MKCSHRSVNIFLLKQILPSKRIGVSTIKISIDASLSQFTTCCNPKNPYLYNCPVNAPKGCLSLLLTTIFPRVALGSQSDVFKKLKLSSKIDIYSAVAFFSLRRSHSKIVTASNSKSSTTDSVLFFSCCKGKKVLRAVNHTAMILILHRLCQFASLQKYTTSNFTFPAPFLLYPKIFLS